MTLDQLRYFYESARFQHVGKAAKSIRISPSAISAAISGLEDELGLPLFHRVGKNIVLSEAGMRLQKEAEALFDLLEGVKSRVSHASVELSGQYRLGASHFLSSHLLTRVWNGLQKKNEQLVGEICSLQTSAVLSEVVAGRMDLGLVFSPFQHPELHQEDLLEGELKIAVRSKHPLLKGKFDLKKFGDLLSAYPSLTYKSQPGVDLCEDHPVFEEFGIQPKSRFLFDNDACAIEKLAISDAWTLLPEWVIQQSSSRVSAVPLPKAWNARYRIAAVVRKDRVNHPVLQALKEAARKYLQSAKP